MEGCGNDYIYINCFEEKVENPEALSIKISDRHFGAGSDGLVLISPSDSADYQMRMFNADGSESQMCGNAIRCVGKFVYDRGMTDKKVVTIETLAGIKTLDMTVEDGKVVLVKVDMGEPILEAKQIPVNSDKTPVIGETLTVDGYSFDFTCVSMGNPHAVTFIDEEVRDFDLHTIGPKYEVHEAFPEKANIEFIKIISRDEVDMRVWERGSGETLACGTGACGVLVAGVLNDVMNRKATIHLIGGDLIIEWDEATNHVYMTGPAKFVFDGEWLAD